MSVATISESVANFALEVGATDPVVAVGGRTQWNVGGVPDHSEREVRAPIGVIEHEPAEMTVRCNAGTTIAELDTLLALHDQMVPFDPVDKAATVGGLLAVGASGHRRLRYGHVRDLVLQMQYVAHDATVVTAGGPTVKNVSGYDLCRLMVGSLGTLGITAEVILRCLPTPAVRRWLRGRVDPFDLRDRLYRPSSILWDGTDTWVLLEGHGDDVDSESEKTSMSECARPPDLPAGSRSSLRPSELKTLADDPGDIFIAEIGVGVVHRHMAVQANPVRNLELQRELKRRFDPSGRLNPSRSVL